MALRIRDRRYRLFDALPFLSDAGDDVNRELHTIGTGFTLNPWSAPARRRFGPSLDIMLFTS